MKKLREKKAVNEILQEARKLGFSIDTTQYSEGRDSIALMKSYNNVVLVVGYDTSNGNFRGSYGDIEFTNKDSTHKNKPRMIILLELFYEP